MNLEDGVEGKADFLADVNRQKEIIRAVLEVGERADIPFVLNARTDIFLYGIGSVETRLARAIERLNAYHAAGAPALFAPGVKDKETIAQLKREVVRCAYCDAPLTRKETDHMTPVCLGGEHSLRNIVIVCPRCNGRKAKLSFAQWIDRIELEHRARVVALWEARFGELATPVGAPVVLLAAGLQVDGFRTSGMGA